MKEEEILMATAFIIAIFCLGVWYYQDQVKALWYAMDTIMLTGLQYLPFFGEHYQQKLNDYRQVEAHWPSLMQYLVAGQSIWRPVVLLVFVPFGLRWAWLARKVRAQQGFDIINQSYIDKHYRTLTPSPKTRQQWTVRHWFHHYGLHKLPWDTDEWHERLSHAFAYQLGPRSGDADSQALLKEFAESVHKELVKSFGAKTVARFKPDEVVAEVTRRHAYRTTAMVRILASARDDYGVVSPNMFRNRLFESPDLIPIWFALNGLGRQTTHIESQGALSHFYYEVAYDEPLVVPHFRNAVKGLEQYREHLLDQLKMPDLDESDTGREASVGGGEDEPRYDYSLTDDEDALVAGR